jgi:molybdopterin synthase sulfur carrier subunit
MPDTSPMTDQPRLVEVHLFAAARAAAGTEVLRVAGGTLGAVLAAAVAQAPGLAGVLDRCSVLVDGTVAHGDEALVAAGGRVDVLPPFAGG